MRVVAVGKDMTAKMLTKERSDFSRLYRTLLRKSRVRGFFGFWKIS